MSCHRFQSMVIKFLSALRHTHTPLFSDIPYLVWLVWYFPLSLPLSPPLQGSCSCPGGEAATGCRCRHPDRTGWCGRWAGAGLSVVEGADGAVRAGAGPRGCLPSLARRRPVAGTDACPHQRTLARLLCLLKDALGPASAKPLCTHAERVRPLSLLSSLLFLLQCMGWWRREPSDRVAFNCSERPFLMGVNKISRRQLQIATAPAGLSSPQYVT